MVATVDPRTALTFTLPDACSLSGLSISTLRRLADRGELRLIRVAGRTLVDGVSLRRLLQVPELPLVREKRRGKSTWQS